MVIAKSMGVYQLSMAYKSEHAQLYYILISVALSFYPLGIYYYKKNDWISTYSHITFHLLSNIGNLILYSGKPV